MNQDFSKKVAIVVRKDLPQWQIMNTVAHISAYMGREMGAAFDTGKFFTTKDGVNYPRNSQYAIIVLTADESELKKLLPKVRERSLPYLCFFREMIEATDDSEIESILAGKEEKDMEYFGIGVFGPKEIVSELTKKFSLYK